MSSPSGGASSLISRDQRRTHIRRTIDAHGFNLFIWGVAASGFFTDSYNLFATNVIFPSLAYVYWPDDTSRHRETVINICTLCGSIGGQLFFGFMGDKHGRTSLYGWELAIVILSTIGVCTSGAFFSSSTSVVISLAVWRTIMGAGIGGEYPLSAVITTEWAPTRSRARMMAAMFMMQPIGQLVAYLVNIIVLAIYDAKYNLQGCQDPANHARCAPYVDSIWRWVTGIGGIPTIVAIIFRFSLHDPGLYKLDVRGQDEQATNTTQQVYGGSIALADVYANGAAVQAPVRDPPLPEQFNFRGLRTYFIRERNIYYLLGTSISWFLLDVAFCGIGMGSPRTLAKIWAYKPDNKLLDTVPSWNPDASHPDDTIYTVLLESSRRAIYTVCIASIAGSILFVMMVNRIPRKSFLVWSFLWLALLFAITGGTFFKVFHQDTHAVTIVLVAICHFSFNFGANTLTFILPAEIFPTRYRCLCHGISAAMGKLGSVIVIAVLPSISASGDPNSAGLGYIFIFFAFVMALGAPFAWAWIPDVQDHEDGRAPSKTLEELGKGRRWLSDRTNPNPQPYGFQEKTGIALAPLRRRFGWMSPSND